MPALCWTLAALLMGCQGSHLKDWDKPQQKSWDGVQGDIKLQVARQQYENGRPDEAARTAQEVIGLEPTDWGAYAVLVRCLLEQSDPGAAAAVLAEAEKRGVNHMSLIYLRGVVEEAQGRLDRAEGYYRTALDAGGGVEPLVGLAEVMVRTGRSEQAYREVISRDLDLEADGTPALLASRLALLLGKTSEAIEHGRKALIFREDAGLMLDLALALCSEKRFDEARLMLTPAVETFAHHPMAGAMSRLLARCYCELDRPADAIRALAPYLKDHPTDIEAQIWYATAALATDRDILAAGAVRAVFAESPGNLEAQLLMATLEYRDGRGPEALKRLQTLLRRDPFNSAALVMYEDMLQGEAARRAGANPAETVAGVDPN